MRLRLIITTLLLSSVLAAASAEDEGLVLWNNIYDIFSHPRCTNCHVGPDNVPIWSGPSYGTIPRSHGMNINAGASRDGENYIACTSCHMTTNSSAPHGPPGSEMWLLAPVSHQFRDKSTQELCEQIKDPTRNGGLSVAEVADHIDHDPVVAWAWDPGGTRETPPYSKDDLVIFLWEWDDLGAPCPGDRMKFQSPNRDTVIAL